MGGKDAKLRELFIEEMVEVTGGNPELADGRPLKELICSQFMTTMACGEEYGPCAPTGC